MMMLGLPIERLSGSAQRPGTRCARVHRRFELRLSTRQYSYESLALPAPHRRVVFGTSEAVSPAEKAAWTLDRVDHRCGRRHAPPHVVRARPDPAPVRRSHVLRHGDSKGFGPWPYTVLALGTALAWLVLSRELDRRLPHTCHRERLHEHAAHPLGRIHRASCSRQQLRVEAPQSVTLPADRANRRHRLGVADGRRPIRSAP